MKKFIKKIIIIVLLLLSLCLNAASSPTWKCFIENMDNSPSYEEWWGNNPVYDPVNDEIALQDFYESWPHSFDIFRFRSGKWKHITILNTITNEMTQIPHLFDETQGSTLVWIYSWMNGKIWLFNIDEFNYTYKDFDIDIGEVYPFFLYWENKFYSIISRPGSYILTLNAGEGMCRPPESEYFYSVAFSFDNKSLSLLKDWQKEWDASPMVWDENRNVLVKYGGSLWTDCYPHGPNGRLDNRMREWDGTTWTLRLDVPDPLPPERCHRMVYDEARGVVVLIHLKHCDDRYCYPPSCSTWEYDGKRWIDVTQDTGSFLSDFYLYHRNRDYLFNFPHVVYDSANNRIALFQIGYDYEYGTGERKELWYLEDDATTQTYSRRNVMQEGCEMRDWGETGVDCAFTSSTKWSRIIVVKTEDGTSPDFARDHPTSGILSATMLWEIKTDRPPEPIPAQTTGTLVSISYPTDLVDRLTLSTDTLRLCVSRPAEPIGVPIADTEKNSDRAFFPWRILQQIDHPPLPGEFGIYHDTDGRRFLFRTTMREPFQGSPSGPPRMDGKPASLCYTIITTAPDPGSLIKDTLLGCRNPSSKERPLLDQNADGIIDIADLVTLLSLWSK